MADCHLLYQIFLEGHHKRLTRRSISPGALGPLAELESDQLLKLHPPPSVEPRSEQNPRSVRIHSSEDISVSR